MLALPLLAACGHERRALPVAPRSPLAAADSLRIEGHSAEAGPLYHALRDSFAIAGDSANLWQAQLWWGDALLRIGHADSARVALRLALALAAGDPRREGRTHQELEIFFDRQGKFDSAFAEAARAQQLARMTGDRVLEADTYNGMGRIHSLTGHYREALADNTRALALKRATSGDTSRAVAVELNELGIDYKHLGRFTDAVRSYEEALAIERRHRNPEGIARVLSNLGTVYTATGDIRKALALKLESLRYAEQAGLVRGQAYLQNDIGDLYTQKGNLTAARPYVERGLEMSRRAGLAYGVAQALDNLGRLELAAHDPGSAQRTLLAARALEDSDGFGRERVTSRALLARVSLTHRDARGARRWANEAVAIADSLGDPEAQVEALEAKGAALESGGDARAAEATYRATIDFLESWRGRMALGDLRMGVAEPRLAAYEGAIRVLLARGKPAEAFEIAERARARLLLNVMAEREARAAHSRADTLRQELRERYAAREDVPATSRATLDREIARLTTALAAAEQDASARSARGGAPQPAPVSLAAARTGLLHSGRALLAFFWGDSAAYGWWITERAVHAARLGASDSIATLVEFLRGTIDRPDTSGPSWIAPARRAFEQLVAPLHPTAATDILVIPDGPIAFVPVDVLVPRDGAPPWGASARFVYGPSASVMLALTRLSDPPRWERTLLTVGDPETPHRMFAALRHAIGLYAATDRGDALAPLPYAAAEARDVYGLFRAQGADLLVGSDATLAHWLALDPGRYRYLHFAAHARVSDAHPERTRLVLAGGSLGLTDIRRLSLNAQLVTLSACETALGQRVRGEGVIGLPYAFLSAGARGVVVTLWRVTDRSAADFMRDFYRELHAGRSPADALLTVRRSRMVMPGAAGHPSRWAPFVLVGPGE